MISVLFLCTGNSCRSQMAEAFLRKLGGSDFEVYSAGTNPKPIHPMTYQVMQEKGYAMQEHTPKSVKEFLGKKRFQWVISVCDQADQACPSIFPNSQARLFWPFEDPAAFVGSPDDILNKFREVRDQIEIRINKWLNSQRATDVR